MSLKKAKDYLGNDLQVDSAVKDAKGQVIHKTYINKTIPDGTIAKNIGVDSNGDIVKETPSSGGGTQLYTHNIELLDGDETSHSIVIISYVGVSMDFSALKDAIKNKILITANYIDDYGEYFNILSGNNLSFNYITNTPTPSLVNKLYAGFTFVSDTVEPL